MLRFIRKRLSYTNLVLTLALVLAMSGGAYAAGQYLITSTKQISPRVLAALKGKPGTKGANGTQGPAGPQGSAGPAGGRGEKGESGETGPTGPTGPAGLAGVRGAVGPRGPDGAAGPEGSPWTAGGTLPAGQTEKGMWSMTVPPAFGLDVTVTSISFGIPLAAAPAGHYITSNGDEIVENESTFEYEEVPLSTQTKQACPGTGAAPAAEAGALCVYATGETLANIGNTREEDKGVPPYIALAPTAFGAVIDGGDGKPGAYAEGTWAVTAPS